MHYYALNSYFFEWYFLSDFEKEHYLTNMVYIIFSYANKYPHQYIQ